MGQRPGILDLYDDDSGDAADDRRADVRELITDSGKLAGIDIRRDDEHGAVGVGHLGHHVGPDVLAAVGELSGDLREELGDDSLDRKKLRI